MRRMLRKFYRAINPEPIPPCDAETVAVLKATLRPDSNTVDIGCNRGSILREMVRLAPAGRHFAFEPIPRLNKLLRRRFPNVTCHGMALSDRKGTIRFSHFVDMDGFSGILQRKINVDPGLVREISVPTERLDDILPDDCPIDLIKIDVEGAEFLVFQGAVEVLQRHRPVLIFECGKDGLDRYGRTPEELFAFLQDFGYSIRKLNGWSPRKTPLSRQEFAESYWKAGEYMFVASAPTPAAVLN